jgi:hypothetical protein
MENFNKENLYKHFKDKDPIFLQRIDSIFSVEEDEIDSVYSKKSRKIFKEVENFQNYFVEASSPSDKKEIVKTDVITIHTSEQQKSIFFSYNVDSLIESDKYKSKILREIDILTFFTKRNPHENVN